MSPLSERALKIAISQLGAEEDPRGSNWGFPVRDYLASVDIHFPASWCMAFMYWCFDKAAKEMDIVNPLVKTGGVLNHWLQAKKEVRVLNVPQPGDIFIMDLGKGLGHTGIIKEIKSPNILTIEGNTNDTGSREGFEVCQRDRGLLRMRGYLRY